MSDRVELEGRIRNAWLGRISGCQLGKPVERFSMREGHDALQAYLDRKGNLPLRDYIEFEEGMDLDRRCCKGHLVRSEPDDDINYSMLALLMLEEHGLALTTSDVARTWMRLLPVAQTYTAERAAYKT
ncbi:MAG: ADP-ribosylglycohydrolase family protein, partial [Pseudomonadota bacterium]